MDCTIALRDLGILTACHLLAAFCLLFNKCLLNELYEPVSVHGGISASMAASPRPLTFSSGGELVWPCHTLSCDYARLEGSLVCSQVQSKDKLQVSGIALAS